MFGSEKHETVKQSAPQGRIKRGIFLRPKGHGLYRFFGPKHPDPFFPSDTYLKRGAF